MVKQELNFGCGCGKPRTVETTTTPPVTPTSK